MKALWWFACVLLGGAPATAQDAPAVAVRVANPTLRVGDVVEVVLEARVPEPVVPALGDTLGAQREATERLRGLFTAAPFAETEPAFELITQGPVVVRREGGELGAWLVARQRAELAVFEAGSFSVPRPAWDALAADAALPQLEVAGVLASGEDAPRPPRGLDAALDGPWVLPPAPEEARWSWQLVAGAGAGLALLAGVPLLLLTRRRSGPRRGLGSPRAALEALRREVEALDDAGRRDAHFTLAALTRRGLARAWGLAPLRGATDDEWFALHAARLGAQADAWRDWFDALAVVKYAGAPATAWALTERIDFALAGLDAAEGTPPGREEVPA